MVHNKPGTDSDHTGSPFSPQELLTHRNVSLKHTAVHFSPTYPISRSPTPLSRTAISDKAFTISLDASVKPIWPTDCETCQLQNSTLTSGFFLVPQPLSKAHYQPIIVIQWDVVCMVACSYHTHPHTHTLQPFHTCILRHACTRYLYVWKINTTTLQTTTDEQ